MAKANFILEVEFKWWLKYLYLPLWNFFANIYNELLPVEQCPEINQNFKWWIKKGITIKRAY